MIVLIDNYDSFTFNLYHYLGGLGAEVVVHRNDKIATEAVIAADPDAIVLSPGPCTPNDAGICLDLIRQASARIPVFGVCLGHQAIGQVFGGEVVRGAGAGAWQALADQAPGRRRVLSASTDLSRRPGYHSLVVERKSLPTDLAVVAETDDRLIMGLAHARLPVHGVQFQPLKASLPSMAISFSRISSTSRRPGML